MVIAKIGKVHHWPRQKPRNSAVSPRLYRSSLSESVLQAIEIAQLVSGWALSAMDEKTTSLERAFELAKSGLCNSVTDIERSLKAEGYSCQQLTGLILRKQLSTLIRNSKE